MLSLLLALASCDKWAVIFTGSRGWDNYRHSGDSYYQYYLLQLAKFPEDHIIFLNYDDIADNAFNPLKGQVFHYPDHKVNCYPGSDKIDYTGTQVCADTWFKVLKGDTSAGGKVLKSTSDDYVYVFFDDHGGDGILGVPDGCGPFIYADDLAQVFKEMKNAGMFKKCFFPVTACYAGSVARVVGADITDLYIITAAGESESSYAVGYDSMLGVYLSSEFSYVKDIFYETNPEGTLGDMFLHCVGLVKQSHVHEYGDCSFKDMKVSNWVGKVEMPTGHAGRQAVTGVPETEATVVAIEQAKKKTGRQQMMMFSERASAMILDNVINHLKEKFVKDNSVDLTKPCKNINWPAYKKVLGTLQKNIGHLGESFWAKTFFFSNLCSIVDADLIVAEINKLC